MSSDKVVTAADVVESQGPVAPSNEQSKVNTEAVKAEKQQLKALLAEARNTRQLMVDFKAAIHSGGSFPGYTMLSIAKGLAFLDAILEQNRTHIKNLEERLEA